MLVRAWFAEKISIHALREEGDFFTSSLSIFFSAFLSTPSARRATTGQGAQPCPVCISIHALREEGDSDFAGNPANQTYFYPRPPRGGRRQALTPVDIGDGISIHALREEGDSKNSEKTLCFCLIIHLPAQIAKRRLQTKPQNHTVTCANGWYSGAKRPGKPCALPVRTGGHQKISTLSCANSGCSPTCSTLVW